MFAFIVLVSASVSALCFLSYLAFLAYVIQKTRSTAGLRDVAVAIRAFKFPFRTDTAQQPSEEACRGENCRRCPRQFEA